MRGPRAPIPVLAAVLAAILTAALVGAPAPAATGVAAPGAAVETAGHAPAVVVTTPTTTVDLSERALRAGRSAWVTVSVATLWRSPSSPRRVDRPALAAPARIGRWLAAMSTEQRRALTGRADTQALLGDRVRVLRVRGTWARVAVPDQPSPLHRRGYPGWVPRRQLTPDRPSASPRVVTVLNRTAWLRTDDQAARRALRVSFGTRLPHAGTVGRFARVRTPDGEVRRVSLAAVAVHPRTEAARPATGRGLVRTARSFTGLDYLWAGRSGFGLDCSGLTSLVHRVHGKVIPRDAAPQSQAGTRVRFRDLRRGDLMFFRRDGVVHHVSMYAGNGRMVHAPRTGSTVEVVPVSTQPYRSEFSGGRRYLG
ncbi:MAG TPA: C40 family peptidase [Nocardioidaceae bacterium]|nr:C40 family peptidase [Nocardioidaceae bacterium]